VTRAQEAVEKLNISEEERDRTTKVLTSQKFDINFEKPNHSAMLGVISDPEVSMSDRNIDAQAPASSRPILSAIAS
jgi:hypothetical protein